MKKIYLLIWTCLIMGCSSNSDIFEPEIGYIDYANYPLEKLTQNDKTLLENVAFREGKLTILLDLSSATEQGISEEKYNYFLEYLQNENLRMERYLDSGAIVFYDGEPFTRNEELYPYIDETDQSLTRATYSRSELVCTHEHGGGYNQMGEYWVHFKGTSKLTISYTGPNTVYLREDLKRISAYIVKGLNQSKAVFKYGFGNNVTWDWKITYNSPVSTKTRLDFYANWEDPMPSPNPSNPNYIYFWDNLPSYVIMYKDAVNKKLYIEIDEPGEYMILMYLKYAENDYRLYRESHFHPSYQSISLPYPQEVTFWLSIYRETIKDNKYSYEYIGDREFPYPPYPFQN